jgi:hypothetical protein
MSSHLFNANTGEHIRTATDTEVAESIQSDAGEITVQINGEPMQCYVVV